MTMNRGTESKNKRVFRVSSLYERNLVFFDDSSSDLTEHLLRYLDGDEYDELQVATEIKPDIDDWTITDLYGSYRDLGAHFANSNAALVGAAANSPTIDYLYKN